MVKTGELPELKKKKRRGDETRGGERREGRTRDLKVVKARQERTSRHYMRSDGRANKLYCWVDKSRLFLD